VTAGLYFSITSALIERRYNSKTAVVTQTLKAELPGIDPKDVELRVADSTLYLKGERKYENEVKEESYHRIERSYGTFTRTFTLPNSISTENIKAEYKDGVLTLTMAKREEAKPKTIKINVATGAQAAAAAHK